MSLLFDTHAHLPSDIVERKEVLQRASQEGVKAICDIATSLDGLEKALLFPREEAGISLYLAAAIHPHDALVFDEKFFAKIEECAEEKRLLAIGEIGLDYYSAESSPEEQKKVLQRQMELARKVELPLIIHCRNAFHDFFELFDAMGKSHTYSGIMHCFTGTKEEAKQALDRGLYISISGIATFPSATLLREIVSYVPEDRILIETDCPYLAPVPYRGKKNEPAYVVEVCRVCAASKNMPLEKFAAISFENAKRVFGI